MGGRERRFPATRHSMVEAARSVDPEERRHAFERVVLAYWKPVYVYLRLRWRRAGGGREGPHAGLLRPRLREAVLRRLRSGAGALPHLPADVPRRVRRQRAGGGAASEARRRGDRALLGLRDRGARPAAAGARRGRGCRTPSSTASGCGAVCAEAVEEVRRRCRASGRELALAVFERCDLSDLADADRPSYAALAAEFGIPLTAGHQPARLRAPRVPRRHARDACARRTASDEEFARGGAPPSRTGAPA